MMHMKRTKNIALADVEAVLIPTGITRSNSSADGSSSGSR
jgi:hypothetical protein